MRKNEFEKMCRKIHEGTGTRLENHFFSNWEQQNPFFEKKFIGESAENGVLRGHN